MTAQITMRANAARQAQSGAHPHQGIGAVFSNVFKRVSKSFKRSLEQVEPMTKATDTKRTAKPRAVTKITRQQIAIVHVAAHQLGMSDEDYRALLQSAAGVRSTLDLDRAGFLRVMQRFEELGFSSTSSHGRQARPPIARHSQRPGMATPAQLHAILTQWLAWYSGAAEDAPRALRQWLERSYCVSDLRFCDVVTAQKALQGLKFMNERNQRTDAKAVEGAKHV